MQRLLLLSNSTNSGESYLGWCKQIISDFIGNTSGDIVFIPYAGVTFSYQAYTDKVNEALAEVGLRVVNIDTCTDKQRAIENATAIFVGGGNTFHLLHTMQKLRVASSIKSAVINGTPYVGWSAGSNVACPTLCATNDMPIIQPSSFEALGLIDCQINPHYTEQIIAGHGGESRLQRLQEYLAVNTSEQILCVPESCYVRVEGEAMTYYGAESGKVLSHQNASEIFEGESIL